MLLILVHWIDTLLLKIELLKVNDNHVPVTAATSFLI
jgi:hypothetical protein